MKPQNIIATVYDRRGRVLAVGKNSYVKTHPKQSYVWTVTYGACLLLNSTHYQKSIGSRDRLIQLYINQVLMTPDKTGK